MSDDAITLDLGTDAICVRLAVAAPMPVYAARWQVSLADVLGAAVNLDRRAAMLQLADSYRRAAESGRYGEPINAAMLAAELRARRLADLLP